METQNNPIPSLDLLLRPAFCVTDGTITEINRFAAPYCLQVGENILPMLATGADEYRALTDGCLYLTLCVGGQRTEAAVLSSGDRKLFILEQPSSLTELRALSLAARELRNPLTGMISTIGQLVPLDADPEQMAQFNRRMHQILRIVSNMSDSVYYCEASDARMECVQICAFLEEILEKAAAQLTHADIRLQYRLPHTPIYTLADTEKIERAVYNLISNAAKHTSSGGSITVELISKNRLYLSVTDSGGSDYSRADVYARYLRTPSVTDGMDGIGLGMVLIRATAALHGGTVLIDRPNAQGTRVTMTLELRQAKSTLVRSPVFYPDYAGERDHCLQELSDILPAALYAT